MGINSPCVLSHHQYSNIGILFRSSYACQSQFLFRLVEYYFVKIGFVTFVAQTPVAFVISEKPEVKANLSSVSLMAYLFQESFEILLRGVGYTYESG